MFARESTTVGYVVAAIDLAVSLVASGHVLLNKRDTRAAIGWIGLIWLSPILGAGLYLLFGINRVHRRARRLRGGARDAAPSAAEVEARGEPTEATVGAVAGDLAALDLLAGRIARAPLVAGNAIEPLVGGDEAYPAMLRAIDGATESVALATYIFDRDRAGRPFIEALARAVARGVAVRVLIDGFGSRHGWPWPWAVGALRRSGVPVARFLPTLAPGWFGYLNLRNHRKILVVDGREAFTGGMNILEDYLLSVGPRRPKRDLHFRVSGPVVAGLGRVFADDWESATGEELRGERWAPTVAEAGGVLARVVVDGPDDDQDTLLTIILGALACARARVAIATPYFLPDASLVAALEVAALRGVEVDILLPGRSNHLLVQWASTTAVREVLQGRCRVWTSPRFDHTKLMVVDGAWSFLGSANWDARSLRLNFELNVECYGRELAGRLEGLFRERLRDAVPVTAGLIDGRSLGAKLRDATARLFSPYL
jgi:cardiolipin synthase